MTERGVPPLPRGKTPRRRRPRAATAPDAEQEVPPPSASSGVPGVPHPPEPRPAPDAPPVGRWGPDLLGDDFEARTYEQPDDDEGAVVTTLVRHRPGGRPMPRKPRFVVVYVHGWADYFIQTELAEFWTARGAAFYAVDLRKSGRSIRPHQTPCFVESLREYDEDLDLAIDVVKKAHNARVPIVYMAHSQGGLTGLLWLRRRPGTVHGVVLNSPFLEMHGSSWARSLSQPLINQLARRQSRWPIPIAAPGFYDRTINSELDGEWGIEPAWRPVPTHPIRPGWLRAVTAGHAELHRGLDLDLPVLVMTSHRTIIGSRWRKDMASADVVLDVKQIWRRVPMVGRTVTLARIHDAVHDVLLSPPEVRDEAYGQIDRWFRGYVEPDLPSR